MIYFSDMTRSAFTDVQSVSAELTFYLREAPTAFQVCDDFDFRKFWPHCTVDVSFKISNGSSQMSIFWYVNYPSMPFGA